MSTIAGWMAAIAAIGVLIGTLIMAPLLFILAVFILLEALAVIRFRESRRRKPMPGAILALWCFVFVVVIPIVSVVVSCAALFAYCSADPGAYQRMIRG
jgi:predicted membrane protein